jgi:hypothetical protein
MKCGLFDKFWTHQEQKMPSGFRASFKELINGMLNPNPTQRFTIE